jgi:hypothetical protein
MFILSRNLIRNGVLVSLAVALTSVSGSLIAKENQLRYSDAHGLSFTVPLKPEEAAPKEAAPKETASEETTSEETTPYDYAVLAQGTFDQFYRNNEYNTIFGDNDYTDISYDPELKTLRYFDGLGAQNDVTSTHDTMLFVRDNFKVILEQNNTISVSKQDEIDYSIMDLSNSLTYQTMRNNSTYTMEFLEGEVFEYDAVTMSSSSVYNAGIVEYYKGPEGYISNGVDAVKYEFTVDGLFKYRGIPIYGIGTYSPVVTLSNKHIVKFSVSDFTELSYNSDSEILSTSGGSSVGGLNNVIMDGSVSTIAYFDKDTLNIEVEVVPDSVEGRYPEGTFRMLKKSDIPNNVWQFYTTDYSLIEVKDNGEPNITVSSPNGDTSGTGEYTLVDTTYWNQTYTFDPTLGTVTISNN